MQLAMLWYRLVKRSNGVLTFEYNHLELGHTELAHPTPVHPNHQRDWAQARWYKEFVKLTDTLPPKVIRE